MTHSSPFRLGALALLGLAFGSACVRSAPAPARTSPTSTRAAEPAGPIRHVVLVTIDGLMPEVYLRPDAHGLKVPTLRKLVAEGGYGEDTRSVLPSVTYPAHTSIATGASPERHGIVGNRVLDPLELNLDAWYWYAEDIKVAPIWDAAERAGLRTGLVAWPVTVGAKVDFLVPEYWRARQPEDLKLLRALSTPGLLEQVSERAPDLWQRIVPGADSAVVDVATHLVERERPHLLLLHLAQVDGAQHKQGPWSAAALAAIEGADAQLARLLASIERAGIAEQTALVVASDHGFAPVTRQVHPRVVLREAGLLTVDAAGKPSAYRASVSLAGGLAYVYLRDEDAALAETTRALFEARAKQPDGGITRIYGREEIRARGGDPRALLALEAAPDTYFGPGLATYATPAPYRGMHGYDPEQPAMYASLLFRAPGVRPGARKGTRIVDIAPTIAKWLALPLPDAEGRPLE